MPGDQGVDHAGLAHARSREQGRSTRVGVFARDEQLKQVVQEKLQVQRSPEQIAGSLRTEHPDRPEWHSCHETIYQGIYFGGERGLQRELTRNLRTRWGLRLRRRRVKDRRPRLTVHSRMIDERPAVVEKRSRLGDFEGDLIVGRHGASAIGTLVDRATGLVRLVHLPDAWHGEATADAIIAAVSDLVILGPAGL